MNNPRGSKHHRAKLTESDIPLIRELVSEGVSLAKTAEKFGIAKGSVSDIVRRRTWWHVA